MIKSTYEVRNIDDPIDGNVKDFQTKVEAIDFVNEFYPEGTIYFCEYDMDPINGNILVSEIQVHGPEVEQNLVDKNIPDSCEGDYCYRAPKIQDDLDYDLDYEDDMTDAELFDKFKEALSETLTEATLVEKSGAVDDSFGKLVIEKHGEALDIPVTAKDAIKILISRSSTIKDELQLVGYVGDRKITIAKARAGELYGSKDSIKAQMKRFQVAYKNAIKNNTELSNEDPEDTSKNNNVEQTNVEAEQKAKEAEEQEKKTKEEEEAKEEKEASKIAAQNERKRVSGIVKMPILEYIEALTKKAEVLDDMDLNETLYDIKEIYSNPESTLDQLKSAWNTLKETVNKIKAGLAEKTPKEDKKTPEEQQTSEEPVVEETPEVTKKEEQVGQEVMKNLFSASKEIVAAAKARLAAGDNYTTNPEYKKARQDAVNAAKLVDTLGPNSSKVMGGLIGSLLKSPEFKAEISGKSVESFSPNRLRRLIKEAYEEYMEENPDLDDEYSFELAVKNMDKFMDDMTDEIAGRFYDNFDVDSLTETLTEFMIDEEAFYSFAGPSATIRQFAEFIINNNLNV